MGVTNKANAKVVGTATLKLAADGKTLTVDGKNIKANGETSNDVAVYERLSGGPGLAGKWKTKNLKIGSPGTMSISPSGPDGLTLTFVEEKGTCTAKFDGKDYPASGPTWPPGWMCAIARNGATALDLTLEEGRQGLFKETLTALGRRQDPDRRERRPHDDREGHRRLRSPVGLPAVTSRGRLRQCAGAGAGADAGACFRSSERRRRSAAVITAISKATKPPTHQ